VHVSLYVCMYGAFATSREKIKNKESTYKEIKVD
jgi:hypothetical protein